MKVSEKWTLNKNEQQRFIKALTDNLTLLRAKIGISQGELSKLVGISRQTYSAIENRRKEMSWTTYLSLILFFDYNQATHQLIRVISAFPDELVERFNNGKKSGIYNVLLSDSKQAAELAEMVNSLDKQGVQALKAILAVEYHRCVDSSSDIVLTDGIRKII